MQYQLGKSRFLRSIASIVCDKSTADDLGLSTSSPSIYRHHHCHHRHHHHHPYFYHHLFNHWNFGTQNMGRCLLFLLRQIVLCFVILGYTIKTCIFFPQILHTYTVTVSCELSWVALVYKLLLLTRSHTSILDFLLLYLPFTIYGQWFRSYSCVCHFQIMDLFKPYFCVCHSQMLNFFKSYFFICHSENVDLFESY